MTGRERIDVAAQELGWCITPSSTCVGAVTYYRPPGSTCTTTFVRVRYNRLGGVMTACTTYKLNAVPGVSKADQVIGLMRAVR